MCARAVKPRVVRGLTRHWDSVQFFICEASIRKRFVDPYQMSELVLICWSVTSCSSISPKPRLSAERVAEFAQIVEAGPEREKDAGGVSILSASSPSGSTSIPRALCRDASEEARLLPHQRKTAPSGARRADRRGVQKTFPARGSKAHLQGTPRRRRSRSGSRCYAAGASARLGAPTGTGAPSCRRMPHLE